MERLFHLEGCSFSFVALLGVVSWFGDTGIWKIVKSMDEGGVRTKLWGHVVE